MADINRKIKGYLCVCVQTNACTSNKESWRLSHCIILLSRAVNVQVAHRKGDTDHGYAIQYAQFTGSNELQIEFPFPG